MESNSEIKPEPKILWPDHSGGDSKPLNTNPLVTPVAPATPVIPVTVNFSGFTPDPIVSMYQGHPYPPELSALAQNPMPILLLPIEPMKQQVQASGSMLVESKEKPYKCAICDKAYSYPGHLKTHVKKIHEAPLKKAQDPHKHPKAILNVISKVLHRSPHEDFVLEALQRFQEAGIVKEEDIDQSMNEFAQGQKSEDLLKLDLANHVYLGMAEHVFNLPPDL